MAELNRTELNTLFDLPFKKANPTLIARIKTLIESAWNKIDDTGGSGGGLQQYQVRRMTRR